MSKRISALLLILFVSVIAKGQETITGKLNGVDYTIFTSSQSPKIKLEDVITFNFTAKTDKDSILLSSYLMGQPARIQVQPSVNVVDMMDIFLLLSTNDIAKVLIPTDSIFKENEQERPPFLPKGSNIEYTLKIEKVQNLQEVIAEKDKAIAQLKAEETDSIIKYVTARNLNPLTTASGLKYVITKPSSKIKPVAGDTIMVNYVGRTIDGAVFDSSIQAEALKAKLEQPGRVYEPISVVIGRGEVIPGWDEAFLLLNEGASATLIIPSDLGYGPQGNGVFIKPFSTLIFDVELVKVKPAKK